MSSMKECLIPAPAPGANTYSAVLFSDWVTRPDTRVVASTSIAIGLVSARPMSQCSASLNGKHCRQTHGSPARTLRFQANFHAHAGACAEGGCARGPVAVRDSETRGAPAALRLPARARWRAEIVGGSERSVAGAG